MERFNFSIHIQKPSVLTAYMYTLLIGYLVNEPVNIMVISSLNAWICIALIWEPCEAAGVATVV